MTLYRVVDASAPLIRATRFDCAFFASGYELRSTHIARQLDRRRCEAPVVIGFEELAESEERKENDNYFGQQWARPIVISGADDQALYQMLRERFAGIERDHIRILVDYSSMSRVWYAAILNWARYADQFAKITVVLLYAVGEHREPVPPMRIQEIVSIPGCEGSGTPLSKSVALFGLGFDGLASLCVLDCLEPDTVYAFLASPSSFKDYPFQARLQNQELIETHARKTFGLPLDSVEQAFGQLSEIISPHRKDADITAVPMGPKPHVLASVLLSMRFEEVGCLRVAGQRTKQETVTALGPVVATEVEFRHTNVERRKAAPTIVGRM